MKRLKLIGLAAIAALALMGVAGTGSASASAATTILCKTESSIPNCPPFPERFLSTTLKASSSNAYFTVTSPSSGTGKINCTASSLKGSALEQTYKPQSVSIESWTLSGCNIGGIFTCTATSLNLNYGGSLAHTEGANGSLIVANGGKGNPGWSILCGPEKSPLVKCTVTFEPQLDVTGGNPAQLTASSEPMSKSGGPCGGSNDATWTFTAQYSIEEPKPLYVASDQPKPVVTALCSENKSPCPAGNKYSNGTVLKAKSTNLTVSYEEAVASPITCNNSELSGQITGGGKPMLISFSSWSITQCTTKAGQGCKFAANELPYDGGIMAFAGSGDGYLGLERLDWSVTCPSVSYTVDCRYRVALDETPISFDGGSPATFTLSNVPVEEIETSWNCPGQNYKISGTFTMTSPNPVYAVPME